VGTNDDACCLLMITGASSIVCTAVFYTALRLTGETFQITSGNVTWDGTSKAAW
jgi:hypothetical protein